MTTKGPPYSFNSSITSNLLSAAIKATKMEKIQQGKKRKLDQLLNGDDEQDTTPVHTAPNTPLPPILALPRELQYEIISKISGEDKWSSASTLMSLRRTHPLFRQLIPRKYHFKSKSGPFRMTQLFYTEMRHPYLIPPDFYPCYDCMRVLDSSVFGIETSFWGGVRPIGKTLLLLQRTCDECWAVWEEEHGQLNY